MKAKMLIGIAVLGLATSFIVAPTANAWHPKGIITKKVQNVTAGGALADANTAATAVEAKTGDTIRYVITVSNIGDPAQNQWNDMAFTKMTDSLPSGVELVGSPTTRKITEDLGLIVPKKSVTKEYTLKVTSKTNDKIITNKACFTGDSVKKDNPQKGCDVATIKVKVPPKPEEPETPEVPETPQTPETPETPESPKDETPEELPKTGPESIVFGGLGLSGLGYAGYSALRSRRDLVNKMLRR